MVLFYDDEDQILPLLIHRVDAGMPPCRCRDCDGILRRMNELGLSEHEEAAPLVA